MTISPVSYSSYQNVYNIKENNYLQKKIQNLENQVSFRGLEKVAQETIETQGKKTLVPVLTATTALFTALGADLKTHLNTKQERKQFDKEFQIQNLHHYSEDYQVRFVEVLYNGKLIFFAKDFVGDVSCDEHLKTEKQLKDWAFKTIQDYKQSGLTLNEYLKTVNYAPKDTRTLLKAYEAPKKVTAYELVPEDVQNQIKKNIEVLLYKTHVEYSMDEDSRAGDDVRVAEGRVNYVPFRLLGAGWPSDKEKFAKWAEKHIEKYEKTGLLPYRYAELYGEDPVSVKVFLWAYEDAKEESAKEYLKENITEKTGIDKAQIDTYLKKFPEEKRILALQDLYINGKNSKEFIQYEQGIAKK